MITILWSACKHGLGLPPGLARGLVIATKVGFDLSPGRDRRGMKGPPKTWEHSGWNSPRPIFAKLKMPLQRFPYKGARYPSVWSK